MVNNFKFSFILLIIFFNLFFSFRTISQDFVIKPVESNDILSYFHKNDIEVQAQLKNHLLLLQETVTMMKKWSDDLDAMSFQKVPINDFLHTYREFSKHIDQVRMLNSRVRNLPAKLLVSKKQEINQVTDNKSKLEPLDPSEQQETFASLLSDIHQDNEAICIDEEKKINALEFTLILPSGQHYKHRGSDFKTLRQLNLYSSQEINDMRLKAERLLVMRTVDKLKIDQGYNQFTLNKFKTFIDSFGKTQRHRYKNETLFIEALFDIEETFWTRSYLRAVFGRPIGSFGVHHQKSQFHLDLFSSKDIKILANVIRNTNELVKLQDLCYAALQGQTNETLKSLKLSSPLYTLISTGKSLYSYFSGDQQLRQVNAILLRFMIADIEEELMINRPGGLKMLRVQYRNRWHKNWEHSKNYKELEDKYLSDDDNDEDFEGDIATITEDSLLGMFNLAVKALENQEDRTNEAKKILSTIEQLTIDNRQKMNRKKRKKFL